MLGQFGLQLAGFASMPHGPLWSISRPCRVSCTAFSALCAATFSLAASAYALWMIASGRVALLLGMRLTDILGAIGLDLAAAIAWARLTPLDIACIALAAIVAAVAAIWRPAQSTGPSKS